MNFESDMRAAVAVIAAETGLKPDDAFAVWYLQIALGLDRQEAVDAASYDGGNDHGKIVGFHFDSSPTRCAPQEFWPTKGRWLFWQSL